MPRTKLNKYSISRAEMDARIIKSAMADAGIFTNCELAKKIGTDAGYLSKGFKNGFSPSMKLRLVHALPFNEEKKEALLK